MCGVGFGFKDHDVKCLVASCLFCNGKISQLRQKEHGHASDVLLPVVEMYKWIAQPFPSVQTFHCVG